MLRAALLVLTLLLAACADEGPVARPGAVDAVLVGPSGAEGAAVVGLVGGGVRSVTPVGATEVWFEASPLGGKVVLVHPDGGELAFRLELDDVTTPPVWVVEEVAGPDDALRPDPLAYRLEFRE